MHHDFKKKNCLNRMMIPELESAEMLLKLVLQNCAVRPVASLFFAVVLSV